MASCYVVSRATTTGKSYHVKYRRGGEAFRIEHAGAFPTRRAADLRRQLVLEWLAAGLNPQTELRRLAAPQTTVGAAADRWLAGRVDIDASTRGIYDAHVRRIRGDLGSWAPDEVGPDDVVAFVAKLDKTLAAGTVRQVLGVLRMILDECDLPANPARHPRVRPPRDSRRVVEPPDAGRVLACVRHATLVHRPALVLLEQTGLRISEALGLEPRDVDPAGRVRVRPETSKRDRPRWVPVDPLLLGEIRLPLPGTRQSVYQAARAGCDAAGLAAFRLHDLRHRRASLWHQQGVPAVELAARLGHAKPSVSLDVYSHVMPLAEIPLHELLLLVSSSARSARST